MRLNGLSLSLFLSLPLPRPPPHPHPRYEDEISKRTDMEFTFVQLKKVAYAACPRGSFPVDPPPLSPEDPPAKPSEA